jgi:1-acyl-sn-glycerol-3-phosphate acyltransferase
MFRGAKVDLQAGYGSVPDKNGEAMTLNITSADDSYVTSTAKASMIFRAIPSFYFYFRMLGTVFSASRQARKKKFFHKEWIENSLNIIRHLEAVGCRFSVQGKKNFIDLESPCVFVGNHMSTLETFALGAIIRPHRKVTFVVKESLVRYPVFKHIMISRDPIVVSRKNPRDDFKAVMEQGKDKLARGVSIVVFPQSFRTTEIHPEKFNSIGVKLARKAQVPLVPLALKTDAWGTGWPVKDLGRIRPKRLIYFSFGQPMVIKGNGKDEHQQIINFISRNLENWRNIQIS